MDESLDGLRSQVRAQQQVIERLEQRLAQLERGDRHRRREEQPTAPAEEHTPDRRQLLTRAATLTAGVVAGGAALALGDASPAAAASGSFDGNPAVTATAVPSSGVAVQATTSTGFAIQATTGASGQAVRGESSGTAIGVRGVNSGTGTGVMGSSTNGTGISGSSNVGAALDGYATSGWGVRATGGIAAVEATAFVNAVHLQLQNNAGIQPPPSNPIARSVGAIAFDQNEQLWLCIASGTPGVWRRLGGANTAGALTTLSAPVRVYDSRPGFPPAVGTKTPLAPGVARACDLKANASSVPAGATAVLVSVVATQTTGANGGFLSLYATASHGPVPATLAGRARTRTWRSRRSPPSMPTPSATSTPANRRTSSSTCSATTADPTARQRTPTPGPDGDDATVGNPSARTACIRTASSSP